MFPLVSETVAKIIPLAELRWLSFGHFEADECGSMNEWLAAPPRAELMHGAVGCRVSIADMADRPPRVLSDGEVVDIGGKRYRRPRHGSGGFSPSNQPRTGNRSNIRKLMELESTTLALMHGSAFTGDTVGAIGALADRFEARLQAGNGALTQPF